MAGGCDTVGAGAAACPGPLAFVSCATAADAAMRERIRTFGEYFIFVS
jgi:hypothetical protein